MTEQEWLASDEVTKQWISKGCTDCHGTGRIADGKLDSFRLSLLADALEDAGCSVGEVREFNDGGISYWYNEAFPNDHHLTPDRAAVHPLLEHLRSPGPHYRGMWSLDLILGKS